MLRHLVIAAFTPALVLTLGLAAPLAHAETLTGTIDDPGLRRKVDLVYVDHVDGKITPPPQPVINQKGNTYLPHIVPVVVGAKVLFKSQDPELHNVYARGERKVIFNNAVLPNMKFEETFNTPGVVHLSCNIHKEMSAYVLVLQNPFWTTPDRKTGQFTIAGLKPGTYTVRIWGERLSEEENGKKFVFKVGSKDALKIATR
jgi:Polysaccharide lyase family 4, domain II